MEILGKGLAICVQTIHYCELSGAPRTVSAPRSGRLDVRTLLAERPIAGGGTWCRLEVPSRRVTRETEVARAVSEPKMKAHPV